MRIFLAGIMQGSHQTAEMHDQGYRQHLCSLLERHLPEAEVYDPLANHQQSLVYEEEQARQVFLDHNAMCAEVDVVIAFVPEASMGTAIEMWEAYRAGRIVIAISGLTHNWAIRFSSHAIYADLGEFEQAVASGRLATQLERLRTLATPAPGPRG